jgi:hypothetical protein
MKTLLLCLTACAALTPVASVQGALVISEVLYNEIGSDAGGEWIEIFNSGPSSIDLTGYKIGDEETKLATGTGEGMFAFPAGAMIASGQVQIVAVSAAIFQSNYGFLPTYEVAAANPGVPDLTVYSAWDPDGTTINMSNTNDQALILGPLDEIVDAASWSGTFAFDPPLNADAEADGQSYERINPYVDANAASDWRLGNPSSPGTTPVPEPATIASLAIALTMAHRARPSQRLSVH